MLIIGCYLWGDAYSVGDVKLLRDMVARHTTVPHEFVCVTDNKAQFEGTGIRAIALDPQCCVGAGMFQQLMPFHPLAGDILGEHILMMDLDAAVVRNIDRIASRDEDLVLWRNPARQPWANPATPKSARRSLYNTSMVYTRAGARPDIWQRLRPEIMRSMLSQDYVSAMAGEDCAYWSSERDGVYRLAREDTPGSGITGDLPDNARIVFFAGSEHKPWLPHIKAKHPWIAEHRR